MGNAATQFKPGNRFINTNVELRTKEEIKEDVLVERSAKRRTASEIIKTANKIKSGFESIVEDNVDNMHDWVTQTAKNNPAKALEMVLKVSEFVVPKLSRDEVVITPIVQTMDYSKLTDEELDMYLKLADKCKINQDNSQSNIINIDEYQSNLGNEENNIEI